MLLNEILLRALAAILIIGAGLAAYWLVNRLVLARAQGKRRGLEPLESGLPAILYFTTPGCMPCKTVQRPALKQVERELEGRLQIIEIDASEQRELADYWGVLSVPTTFIIDSRGRPRRINHGVVRADRLLKQIEEVEGDLTAAEQVVQIAQAK